MYGQCDTMYNELNQCLLSRLKGIPIRNSIAGDSYFDKIGSNMSPNMTIADKLNELDGYD